MVTSLRTIILMAARNLATCPRSSCKNSYRNEMEKKLMLVKRLKTRGREVQQQEYAENALIRDSDLSGGRGGSRIFLGGGALVSCSTSTPINHIVFFFFFCRIPVVLENRRSFQEGGCAPPAPPPPPRSAPALDNALSSF